ncbi:hypothetical protein [Crocosphaera chwakensis]|uniref:DUF2281 domain-containing protein n=1 Tax=Crocosphaera chwakensis CCY0110 TaxID=391612 RepID=A3IRT1_9CHRO|nr:hypothetical protein [Crocosphaera chwakensis]EAZ90782.1 hypothetical protein CY0110_30161 [Crocosphaera chwakensis CCY0110]
MPYKLFDSVKLKEGVSLSDGRIAPVGTLGTIVEVFNEGEAYLVELFGRWVKYNESENFVSVAFQEKESFMETIGVETVYPHQLELVQKASEMISVRGHLLSLLDELSDEKVVEVRDFAEFLQQKQVKEF